MCVGVWACVGRSEGAGKEGPHRIRYKVSARECQTPCPCSVVIVGQTTLLLLRQHCPTPTRPPMYLQIPRSRRSRADPMSRGRAARPAGRRVV